MSDTSVPSANAAGATTFSSTTDMTRSDRFVRYSPQVEEIKDGEVDLFDKIEKVMMKQNEAMTERYGRAIRASHAKPHGLVKGELRVREDLPEHLRQGLFAQPGKTYPLLARLSTTPGEILDDDVSTPRGFAIKVLGVEGPKITGDDEQGTQDFLLVNGKRFIASNAGAFLVGITQTEAASPTPEGFKKAVSKVSEVTNKALNAVGVDSANLGFFGHPPFHPLGECYFSQQAFRFGDYVCKIGLFPASANVKALAEEKVDVSDDRTALRRAVEQELRTGGAEYELRVQLCTDLDKMPVEDAHKEWDEDDSPYVPVARIVIAPQESFGDDRRKYFDEALSFSPAHGLEAHRPLGQISRARLHAYARVSQHRHDANGASRREPTSLQDVPD